MRAKQTLQKYMDYSSDKLTLSYRCCHYHKTKHQVSACQHQCRNPQFTQADSRGPQVIGLRCPYISGTPGQQRSISQLYRSKDKIQKNSRGWSYPSLDPEQAGATCTGLPFFLQSCCLFLWIYNKKKKWSCSHFVAYCSENVTTCLTKQETSMQTLALTSLNTANGQQLCRKNLNTWTSNLTVKDPSIQPTNKITWYSLRSGVLGSLGVASWPRWNSTGERSPLLTRFLQSAHS